ncbi:hypothetical protein [Rhizobium sp. S96]|jgi:hypothetical protein|uniref:hypothetical protein n=1 Tax=Rhizobium sp. S96 TaxID=3055140 RepID=UPI0025AAB4E4|nr:hypothetical protein [Rhizobium sp. S96]MDM9622223.1 hypothetical protein [Rhizobium sp. S96]
MAADYHAGRGHGTERINDWVHLQAFVGFAAFSQGVDDKEKEPAFIWPRGERRAMLLTATNPARQIPSTRMEVSSERRTS